MQSDRMVMMLVGFDSLPIPESGELGKIGLRVTVKPSI